MLPRYLLHNIILDTSCKYFKYPLDTCRKYLIIDTSCKYLIPYFGYLMLIVGSIIVASNLYFGILIFRKKK